MTSLPGDPACFIRLFREIILKCFGAYADETIATGNATFKKMKIAEAHI